MNTPPRISFACPLPWEKLSGSERDRFCTQCGCHVANMSLLSEAERLALYERAKTERVCGTYLMRLSGEMVTPDSPLAEDEKPHVRQLGVARFSAAALAVAAGYLTPSALAASQAAPKDPPIVKQDGPAEQQPQLLPEETRVFVFMGIVCPAPPPKAAIKHGPRGKR